MCRGERPWWWLGGASSILSPYIFIGDNAERQTRCRGARVAFCTSCCLSAHSLTFTVDENQCAGLVVCVFHRMKAEGVWRVRRGPSFCTLRVAVLLYFPGSSFLGLFWGRFGLWNEQAVTEGRCVLMKEKGGRQKAC